ncbi:MAG TPA: hypothetical protein VKU00_18740 [Chthonomonadaceae bacterium]|nr:hypothetical protein [Chthonomonadaceae bacterium]
MPHINPASKDDRAASPMPPRCLLTGCLALACLLSPLSAAHAHDGEEAAPPELILAGLVAFVLVSLWLLIACYRAWRTPRKTSPFARRARPLTLGFPRWVLWDSPRRPAKRAARSAQRSDLRRRD